MKLLSRLVLLILVAFCGVGCAGMADMRASYNFKPEKYAGWHYPLTEKVDEASLELEAPEESTELNPLVRPALVVPAEPFPVEAPTVLASVPEPLPNPGVVLVTVAREGRMVLKRIMRDPANAFGGLVAVEGVTYESDVIVSDVQVTYPNDQKSSEELRAQIQALLEKLHQMEEHNKLLRQENDALTKDIVRFRESALDASEKTRPSVDEPPSISATEAEEIERIAFVTSLEEENRTLKKVLQSVRDSAERDVVIVTQKLAIGESRERELQQKLSRSESVLRTTIGVILGSVGVGLTLLFLSIRHAQKRVPLRGS